VKPEAIIVGPGDRTGPEVGETATDGEAEAPTDEAGVADAPAETDAAGPAGLIVTTRPARAIAKTTAAATPRAPRRRDLPATRLLPDDEVLPRPVAVTSLA
jgi:hypothetical protein